MRIGQGRWAILRLVPALLGCHTLLHAQAVPEAPRSLLRPLSQAATQATPQPALRITLEDAIHRAQSNEPAFAASVAASRIAQLDRAIARNALLPGAVYHNQVLYTQPNGDTTRDLQGPGNQPSPRFIANNAVREYASQAIVNETVGVQQAADLKLATATALRAAAEAEVARRGLVSTVVSLFYGSLAATRKLAVAERANTEAAAFTDLTQKREQGRESAHADVVKAQLLQQQRQRDLADAVLAEERARLELALLLFADPHTPYSLVSDASPALLASRAEIEAAAARNNPDLRAAFAALREGDADLLRARAAYLPDLGLSFAYGIDAPQFAVNGPLAQGTVHVRNLGYSAALTLDIPVWDWLSTDKRVKQSQARRQVAQVTLSAAQKRLIVDLDEFYNEAAAAQSQVASLNVSASTAAESLRLTKLRYGAGEATVLEVVDAQTALTLAENASAEGQVRYWSALANLQTLTGAL
ncbi:MAG TPA: TolC family protein [Acidobacteriaceae bacterium]